MTQVSWFIPKIRKLPWQKFYNYSKMPASVWIRSLQLVPFLKTHGITSRINAYDERTKIAVFLRRWDKKEQCLAQKLKVKGVKIILDTPVNYFSKQQIPAFEGNARNNFLAFADVADIILCPSQYIEQFGRKEGYKTLCMEDSIDLNHFSCRKVYEKKEIPVLIWSGVSVKAGDLNFLSPIIKRRKWPVITISDIRPQLEFNFEFIKWKYESFPHDIVKGDVAIFPRLLDNEYDLGHSFFKIGVFLAQHIPVICTPLPSYKRILNESNSISIETPDIGSWEKALSSVCSGEKTFNFKTNPVTEFTTEKITEKYKKIFSDLLA